MDIDGEVLKPILEHPKRPVMGMECKRSEVTLHVAFLTSQSLLVALSVCVCVHTSRLNRAVCGFPGVRGLVP